MRRSYFSWLLHLICRIKPALLFDYRPGELQQLARSRTARDFLRFASRTQALLSDNINCR